MESVNKKVIFLALIMALVTSFLVYTYVKKATTKPETVEYTKVYVAAKTMPAKYKVQEDDLKEAKVTRELVNVSAVLNKADIIGKRIKDRIIEGEQILRDRLVEDKMLNLAYNVPDGKRAVSIAVTEEIQVANLIKPDDMVDVVASFEFDKDEGTIKVTRTIVQNVQILALGQEMTVSEEKKEELPKTVTLAVSPSDAEKVIYAAEFGRIRLALRNAEDKRQSNPEGVIKKDIMPNKALMQGAAKQ
ncbi:MAG: Flp pilus assembly protein CpaB [Clostridia bacterium]|nr:Flp pilus assembly protein CpaB [Clostridia bacterium]